MSIDVDTTWKPDPETGLPTLDQHREIEFAKIQQPGFGGLAKPQEHKVELVIEGDQFVALTDSVPVE